MGESIGGNGKKGADIIPFGDFQKARENKRVHATPPVRATKEENLLPPPDNVTPMNDETLVKKVELELLTLEKKTIDKINAVGPDALKECVEEFVIEVKYLLSEHKLLSELNIGTMSQSLVEKIAERLIRFEHDIKNMKTDGSRFSYRVLYRPTAKTTVMNMHSDVRYFLYKWQAFRNNQKNNQW